MALLRRAAAAAAVGLTLAAPANADSIAIESGTAVFDPLAGPGPSLTATLEAAGFSVSLRWQNSTGPCVTSRCAEGSLINLSALGVPVSPSMINVVTAGVENTATGGATVGGETFSNLAFAGALTFLGPDVVLPPVPTTGPPAAVSFTLPFTFQGSLSGYRVLGVADPQLVFTRELHGLGTLQARFIDGGTSRSYTLNRIEYTFEPVPEPATLLLVGAGLAGCVRLRAAACGPSARLTAGRKRGANQSASAPVQPRCSRSRLGMMWRMDTRASQMDAGTPVAGSAAGLRDRGNPYPRLRHVDGDDGLRDRRDGAHQPAALP